MNELVGKFGLPKDLTDSVNLLWNARNRLIHNNEGSDADILRAIDSGLIILNALQAVRLQTNIVDETDIPMFGDSLLTLPIKAYKGVKLRMIMPDGKEMTKQVLPTTRSHFVKGKQVAWEWDSSNVFDQAWYRDSETGESKMAWGSSTKFIGRHLDDI